MMALHFLVVLLFIFIGARLGGIGIGFAGGAGVLVLALLGVPPGDLPVAVITIIMAVIVAISAMQVAGGMDYLVNVAERILRRNPTRLSLLAPVITYLMTLMAGTGHTAFSVLPVITEVARENDIRPSRPLSMAVVSSQIAITASPISAAVVAFSGMIEGQVDYLELLMVVIPTTFLACLLTSAIMVTIDRIRGTSSLSTLPEYQRRLAAGLVAPTRKQEGRALGQYAQRSVMIFLLGLLAVMTYATLISEKVGLIDDPVMTRDQAIIAIMLTVGTVILITCHVAPRQIINASSVFKSGMSAAICVLGVAWLGTSFVAFYEETIMAAIGDVLSVHPWTLAIVLFFASALLYSQAAATKALMPTALAIGVAPVAAVASFAAVSALFVLPTYPTLLAAVEIDDTGSTRIGKYVFDHPFLVPGALNIAIAVALGFAWAPLVI